MWEMSFSSWPHEQDQGFRKCVEATHVSWLMDSGLFQKRFSLPAERRKRAMEEVRRIGYEYHISKAEVTAKGEVKLTVENRGVAPFYYDWPVEFALLTSENALCCRSTSGVRLRSLLPSVAPTKWRETIGTREV